MERPQWEVNEQRNQTANGGNGGGASISQAGYNNDITLDIGHNALAGWALEIIASEANILDGANDHTLSTVGHGGHAFAIGGSGGNGGLEGAVNSLQTGLDPNLVDSDYNYDGSQQDGDTPYAIDAENAFHLGTDRRGGNGGTATVAMNVGGTGATLGGRGSLDYGVNSDGADITIQTNDASGDFEAGYDGIYIHTLAGPGSNQNSAMHVNAAIVGHHGFGEATGGTGGNGIDSSLASTISEGDGGDGGSGNVLMGAIRGNVEISNIGNVFGSFIRVADELDNSGDDKSTNIVIEATGGTISDSIANRAEARAGHFTQVRAYGGLGGNASSEAGAPPSFPASISAQGGDGGDAFTSQGQLEGDISVMAENSVIVRAMDGMISPQVTVAAIGHRETAAAYAGTGGFGGTAAAEQNAQSIYFIYEALREFHARGNDFGALSTFEQKLVAPFVDYFENKPGELEVFLDRLVGDEAGVIANNARDDNGVLNPLDNSRDYTIPVLTSGTGHVPGSNDGEIETMLHILAASGHGGNAVVRQGSESLGGAEGILAASGDITVTAYSYDLSDASRGYIQLASADALASGMMLTHLGHQAEVYGAIAGNGQNLSGANADANGIGGDGGDAIADQYALNGNINVNSAHKITIQAMDVSPDAQEVRSYVGHRLNIGSDYTGYRAGFVIASGNGGGETDDAFDDGRNGNGGDVYVWQRGVVSGSQRGDEGRYGTEIQLAALEDADDDISVTIEALAVGPTAPDVETHIGHDVLLASAKAGDAGRQGALTGPAGASEGLLEGNGGDIFITQTDLGADIDIVGRDAIAITSQTSTSGGNWANLTIGHQRTIGESSDSDNPRSGLIIAGAGGDAHVEDVNASDLANADAAAEGFLEDADSGRIEIVLGKITDSREEGDDQRLITITSITEDVDILSQTALGTSHLEIGNQQHVIASTGEAGDYIPDPFDQTAGNLGGIYIARDTISGDILIQALDADRANSSAPAEGKQVTIRTVTAIGNATLQIGHETEFYATTGRSGFGETREYLRSALFAFATLTAPGTVADTVAGQATMADAQNAVEDMEDLVSALELAYRYADRFPASDGVADANDAGDLLAALNAAKAQLAAAKAALANIGNGTGQISAETAIGQVQQSAALLITARDDFAVVLSTIPQAGSLIADHADAGDIVYGSLAPRSTEYGTALTLGYEVDASALPAQVRDTGAVGGNIDLLSGRYTGVVSNWRDQSVVGNDAIVANNFGGSGFTTADDLHDGVVLIEATANVGTVLTEIGHRRSMTNTTGLGGGDTNAAPEEGGVAGDGGSIASNNTTSGDVFVRAEEVVVTLGGSAGVSEIHLLHSDSLSNTAGWSDIQSLVGNGGDITNATTVSGMVSIEAERIASAVDAQDRTLLATGLANSYLHLGQQVTTLNRSNSDPVEPANLGDSQDNLGSNRGGRIISSQTISGANATLVSIELDVNGDGIEGDLIIETNGAADSRIRLGNSGDAGPGSPVQTPEKSRAAHTGFSGTNNDDGAAVTLTQDVTGDIRISQVEDLAVRALGAAANDIWIGHAAIQWGQSGEINAADGTPQYGELVRVSQLVSADIVFTPWSSFEATIGAASTADLLIGHLAWQVGLSADDSGEPSDFDVNDNGASRAGVNDSFVRPDVLASQIVDGDLSITTGEILLDNQNIQTLRVGHQAYHEASVDGDKTGVSSATNVNNFFQGKPSGFVNAISVINSDGSDIRFTATGATGQVDTVLVATNGTQGDITLQNTVNAGTVQVGHRSVSKMSDGPIIAEGFYQTLQAIGSYVDADGDREVDDTGNSVIAFDAAQDIELLDLIGGTVQVGHYITETADLQAFPVATNDADGIVLAPRLTDNDSRLRQIVGSDILFGSNANQGSGGVGTGGAGNNLVMISTGGRVMIGHMSPDSNQWQVEGGVGSITDQVLDGDIIVEAGTDAGIDLPNGAAPGAGGSENGQGDDITLDATAGGVVRIGHNQANAVEGIANETQISAGDIWVRAGGDLHVLAAGIGHENYDFGSVPVSTATSSPEGLAAGIRDRIRGNTTIGAGQNSAQEDSTLQANVMLFDGAAGPVQVNSGYGGIADRDVDGELRFFLPAQEGLTIVGPVAFNDSGSNGDPVTDRSADPTNVFEGTGGLNHEHYFALMANGQDYTDEFIGLGNFTFYFEEPPTSNRTVLDYYSPYIDGYDFDNGFSVIYRDGTSGSAVNSGVVASGNVVGTGSNNFSCGNEAEPDAAQQPDLEQACTEIIESYEGQNSGFGSNSQFPGTAGGNQAFQPIDNLGSLPEGPGSGDVSAYRIEMPLQARVADTAINFASLARTAPIQAVVAPQLVITHRDGPVVMPALQIALPGTELAYSAFAGASGAAPFPFQERTYGEYLRGGEAAELQIKRIFGPVLSAATPASVYQADAL